MRPLLNRDQNRISELGIHEPPTFSDADNRWLLNEQTPYTRVWGFSLFMHLTKMQLAASHSIIK
jgi:hypothetical protein